MKDLDKTTKTRVRVTMTRLYLNALDSLVEHGIYLDRGEAILAALRIFFRRRGIDSFAEKAEAKT